MSDNETTLRCPTCDKGSHPCGFNVTDENLYCLECAKSVEGDEFPLIEHAPLPVGGMWAGALIRVRPQPKDAEHLICYVGACDAKAHACGYNRITHGLYCRWHASRINHRSDLEHGGEFYPLLQFARPLRRSKVVPA